MEVLSHVWTWNAFFVRQLTFNNIYIETKCALHTSLSVYRERLVSSRDIKRQDLCVSFWKNRTTSDSTFQFASLERFLKLDFNPKYSPSHPHMPENGYCYENSKAKHHFQTRSIIAEKRELRESRLSNQSKTGIC